MGKGRGMGKEKRAIGVLPGNRLNYVDHLVPLCQMMNIPLLCTDKWIYELIDLYYPAMSLICEEPADHCFDHALAPYEVLFYVDLFRSPHGAFQFCEYSYSGKARSVCAQHGNSDKKRNVFWAEKHADEDVVLLNGQHMIDFMKEKNVIDRIPHLIRSGNFRQEYYLKNQSFFEKKINLPRSDKKTVLYAPTWSSLNALSYMRSDYSSFLSVHTSIFDRIPPKYRLFVKLHPYLFRYFPEEIEEIKRLYAGSPQIYFLDDIPLIYPLLEQIDIYLGDYSSIGYDFLVFNRPLFFLNMSGRDPLSDKGVYLFNCGRVIDPNELHRVYEIMDETDSKQYEKARLQTYAYAFGKERKSLSRLKKEIEEVLNG